MAFEQSFIEQVRQAASIVEIIGEKIAVKRKGTRYVALCPFHNDSNPSMQINEQRQMYKCFACGEGGDVFKFLQKHESMSFVEAVKYIAERKGIALPEQSYSRPGEDRDLFKEIKTANELAAKIYSRFLLKHKDAKPGRDYVRMRKLTLEQIKTFRIGYAPDSFNFLTGFLQNKIDAKRMKECGLFGEKESTGRIYDFFRDRVMFPIINERGEIMGFGGRCVGENPAKYVNTRETAVFKKSELLYGLNTAYHLMHKLREAYVVEGYLDVIAAQSAGLPAVAPLGTALTSQQITKLKRYADRYILLFDGDAAGKKAAFRAAQMLAEAGHEGFTVILPPGEDPFDFVQKRGTEAFAVFCRETRVSIWDFIIDEIVPTGDMTPAQKKTCALHFNEILSRMADALVREEFKKRIAARLEIDSAYLGSSGAQQIRRFTPPSAAAAPVSTGPKRVGIANAPERHFIHYLCEHPEFISQALGVLDPAELLDPAAKAIYRKLLTLKGSSDISIHVILELFPHEAVKDYLRTLLFKGELNTEDPMRSFNEVMCKIKITAMKEKSRVIGEDLQRALAEADETKVRALQEKKLQLRIEEQKLKDFLGGLSI